MTANPGHIGGRQVLSSLGQPCHHRSSLGSSLGVLWLVHLTGITEVDSVPMRKSEIFSAIPSPIAKITSGTVSFNAIPLSFHTKIYPYISHIFLPVPECLLPVAVIWAACSAACSSCISLELPLASKSVPVFRNDGTASSGRSSRKIFSSNTAVERKIILEIFTSSKEERAVSGKSVTKRCYTKHS